VQKAILNLFANPLGDLYVEWKIPIVLLTNTTLKIDLPVYKYEMSIFLGIPIPLSSIAEPVETEVLDVTLDGHTSPNRLSYKVVNEFKGYRFLIIEFDAQLLDKKESVLTVQFVVKKIVTKDRIFFNFVYTISSPMPNYITADINVIAHFSYHISSHRFKTVLIDEATGRITFDTELIKHWRVGDFIHGRAETVAIPDNGILDLHVHGSRLPFKIDRRIFWIFIFLLSVIGIGGILVLVKFMWNLIFV
jgi:hypothetical protein